MEGSALYMWNSTGQAFRVWYFQSMILWVPCHTLSPDGCRFESLRLSCVGFNTGSQNHLPQDLGLHMVFHVRMDGTSWVWFIPPSSGCCYIFLEWLVVICFLCAVSGWRLLFSLHYFYKNDMQIIKIKIKLYIISYMCASICIYRYIVNWWAQCVV